MVRIGNGIRGNRTAGLGLVLSVIMLLCLTGQAVAEDQPATGLTDLSLEELMTIKVTTVSKRAENISDAAAAVYVLKAEDIRRSGAASIPEALRMVPGVEVAQLSANMYAVSARGFNGTFANKLLVMIDGRSVYTPLYSGVFWDVQDVLLEDIDRIEVVRGPGATLWGANAVNGVINIITERSDRTKDLYVKAAGGTIDRNAFEARYGFDIGPRSTLRLFARQFSQNQFDDSLGLNSGLRSEIYHGGFRYDTRPDDRHDFTFQGDWYSGESALDYILPTVSIPYQYRYSTVGKVAGGNLLSRWTYDLSANLQSTFQAYFDYTKRDDPVVAETRQTIDLDYQQEWLVTDRFTMLLGLGYRNSTDDLTATPVTTASPLEASNYLWSSFVQGDIRMIPRRVTLTLGSKFEHNGYTGFDVQPSIRAMWTPTETNSIWAAVSRAVRTPSRGEREGLVWLGVIPPLTLANPTALPMKVKYVGTTAFQAEDMVAYEIGYRTQPTATLWIDVAAFYNQYHKLISAELGSPYPEDSVTGAWVLPFSPSNSRQAVTKGVEIATDWQPIKPMRIRVAYTHIDASITGAELQGATAITFGSFLTPQNQLSVRSIINPYRNVDLDLWARYVDRIPEQDVPGYVSLDARIGVRINHAVEVGLTGKNLLDDNRLEFRSEMLGRALWTGRRILGTVTWNL